MIFGLKNAPMTFNRMMNRLIGNREDSVFFFDDVTIFHIDWEEHVKFLHDIFQIFTDNNLKEKPSKTSIGFQEVDFLVHIVGGSYLKQLQDNNDEILKLSIPKAKK